MLLPALFHKACVSIPALAHFPLLPKTLDGLFAQAYPPLSPRFLLAGQGRQSVGFCSRTQATESLKRKVESLV